MTVQITRDESAFRPVTIRVESQDELDKLLIIINNVACNRISHTPQVIRAAVDFRNQLFNIIEGE